MKKAIMNLALMLIVICAFAQAPDWQWAVQAGGSEWDEGYAIVIDEIGNSYVTGRFKGTATFGYYSLSSSGGYDIFVAKMDATGNWLWATQAGGIYTDSGKAIAIDDNGNSYVTGYFRDTTNFGYCSLTSYGWYDIFVAKMDATGNWLWATQAGGSDYCEDYGKAIALDGNGNSYVTGFFGDTATFGSYSLISNGGYDIFVAKMDVTGNWLWATKAGGSDLDLGNGIVIDNNGNSYVTGMFEDTANFGSYFLTSSGDYDIFIAHMDVTGNWLWATKAGGSDLDISNGIVIDNNRNSYVTGMFEDTASFDSYSLSSSGWYDIFVAKMDATGNWVWAAQAGGSGYDDAGRAIAIDDYGNSYVTGGFEDTATFDSYSLINNGQEDVFIAKIDADGNWLWATSAGGSEWDLGSSIAIDIDGNSYVTGYFRYTATFGSYSLTDGGPFEVFVAKLGSDTSAENEIIPTKMELTNYPNPFYSETTISFSTKQNSIIELNIYNIKGQQVRSIFSGQQNAGDHSITWNGRYDNGNEAGSGIYLYKLQVNDRLSATKKCLLLR